MIDAIQKRIHDTQEFLLRESPECFTEQKHLNEGSQERVYWHYGYLAALKNIREQLGVKAQASLVN